LNPAFSISARIAAVCPLRTASGLMMLNVRCDMYAFVLLKFQIEFRFVPLTVPEKPPFRHGQGGTLDAILR
jgi:hypothetical protein